MPQGTGTERLQNFLIKLSMWLTIALVLLVVLFVGSLVAPYVHFGRIEAKPEENAELSKIGNSLDQLNQTLAARATEKQEDCQNKQLLKALNELTKQLAARGPQPPAQTPQTSMAPQISQPNPSGEGLQKSQR